MWSPLYDWKRGQAQREQSCRQLLCKLHLRLWIFIEGSNNLCFPLSVSFPHLFISPYWRTKGHLSLSVCSLFSSISLFLSHLLPDEMHTCSNGRIETRRNEQLLRQMGGWREVLKKQQDRPGYIFNKYDHRLLTDPLSRFGSIWHLW